jgi:dTDP-4-amino-4,6-dideoxygalactose transaminase
MNEAGNSFPIPFNRPFRTGSETQYIEQAIGSGQVSAGGGFTKACESWLEAATGARQALLTHSGTGALELAALLIDGEPGAEVIMPSFTFPTTASAFARRGFTPVFVDIEAETLTLDPAQVEAAITDRTVAIVPVHYAGVGCEMGPLLTLAERHGLKVVEDAAQGLLARRDGKALGGSGDLATISFHETKNVTCGEGGALLVNDPTLVPRAETLRDKGTNRAHFERGEVDKYTWVELGSAFAMSDVSAAFLWAQLEEAESITASRRSTWESYREGFAELEAEGLLRLPRIPAGCDHNAHTFYVLLAHPRSRGRVLADLNAEGVNSVFHYVPLHSSPAGMRYGRADWELPVTDKVSAQLVRLPLWAGMKESEVERVVDTVVQVLRRPG